MYYGFLKNACSIDSMFNQLLLFWLKKIPKKPPQNKNKNKQTKNNRQTNTPTNKHANKQTNKQKNKQNKHSISTLKDNVSLMKY